jgi:hypothetical protein
MRRIILAISTNFQKSNLSPRIRNISINSIYKSIPLLFGHSITTDHLWSYRSLAMLPILLARSFSAKQFAADFNFRILNQDGWTGPKASFEGYTGFAVLIPPGTRIETFFAKKRTRPEVIVLPLSLVTNDSIEKLQSFYYPKPYLQGIVVLGDDTSPHSYDVPFPNADQSYYPPNGYRWNRVGDSLSVAQTDVPLIYPPEAVKKLLLEHIATHGPHAGIYIRLFMEARKNDVQCLKDATCMFIGGVSLFGSFDGGFDGPAVWAVSSMDSNGLFPYGATGADAAIAGFVAHLLALESFRDANWTYATRPLRFLFLDAEAHGYLGGHRFLKDIAKFECSRPTNEGKSCASPYRTSLAFQNVSLPGLLSSTIVEMISVANASKLYAHSSSTRLVQALKEIPDLPIEIEPTKSKVGLPPSSMHSFLKYNSSIEHVVLAGFDDHYPDRNRYGSPSDVVYDADAVTRAAQTLADVLARLCNVTLNRTIDSATVKQLMDGFVGIPRDSPFLVSLFPNQEIPSDHVSLYSGVYNGYSYALKHLVVRALLADAIADNRTNVSCAADSDCTHFGGGWGCSRAKLCQHTAFHSHPAYSSAYEFEHDRKKWVLVNESAGLPRAVESDWVPPDLRLITLPSVYTGRIACGIGLFLWAVSAAALGIFWSNNLQHLKSKE